jgi:hypothetical protein
MPACGSCAGIVGSPVVEDLLCFCCSEVMNVYILWSGHCTFLVQHFNLSVVRSVSRSARVLPQTTCKIIWSWLSVCRA